MQCPMGLNRTYLTDMDDRPIDAAPCTTTETDSVQTIGRLRKEPMAAVVMQAACSQQGRPLIFHLVDMPL